MTQPFQEQLPDKTLTIKSEGRPWRPTNDTHTFLQIDQETLVQWRDSKEKTRGMMFSIAVCHAVLLARQSFGWHGNHRRYPLQMSILNQALLYATEGRYYEQRNAVIGDLNVSEPTSLSLTLMCGNDKCITVLCRSDGCFVKKVLSDASCYDSYHHHCQQNHYHRHYNHHHNCKLVMR